MDPRCFVRVRAGRDGNPPGGTGYLIDNSRVLTAAHTVGELGSTTRIECDVENRTTPEQIAVEVAWRGEGACDIAVLALQETASFDVPIALLEDSPPPHDIECRSKGWALAAQDHPRVRDSMLSLDGSLAVFLADQRRAQITVRQVLNDPRRWRGISGAPVFAKPDGRKILAILGDYQPTESSNIFNAVPLTLAFAEAGFRKALGSEIAYERRSRLICDVRKILRESNVAARALAETSSPWTDAYSGEDIESLTDAILTSTEIGEALLAMNQAHRSQTQSDVPDLAAARVIARVFARLTPLLLQAGLMHALPHAAGGAMIHLPFDYGPIAELPIAAGDGRASRYITNETGELQPLGSLPDPVEPGFDFQGTVTVDDYRTHLGKKLLTEAKRRTIQRAAKTEEIEQTLLFRVIDQALEYQAEKSDQPLRRYLLYDSAFAKDNSVFLTEFHQHLPSVHLVELTGGDVARELAWALPIQELHARHAESALDRTGEL